MDPFQCNGSASPSGLAAPTLVASILGAVIFRKKLAHRRVFVSIITRPGAAGPPSSDRRGALQRLQRPPASIWFTVAGFGSTLRDADLLSGGGVAVGGADRRPPAGQTRAGLILQAIRDDGEPGPLPRLRHYGLSDLLLLRLGPQSSGFASMLVLAAEFASPTFMDLTFSITMVVWAERWVDARRSGACIGAMLISTIEASMGESATFMEAWKGRHRPDV